MNQTSTCSYLLPCSQEIALKLRTEGKEYNPHRLKRKQRQQEQGHQGSAHKKAKVKVKSSQRNKSPYHVGGLLRIAK